MIGVKKKKSRAVSKESAAEWAGRPRQIFVGKGLIDGGSVDVDFSDCAFYPTYTLPLVKFSFVERACTSLSGIGSSNLV
jgi:hypothetical protein